MHGVLPSMQPTESNNGALHLQMPCRAVACIDFSKMTETDSTQHVVLRMLACLRAKLLLTANAAACRWSGALRSLFASIIYSATIFERLPVTPAADVAKIDGALPVVVFSHGMAGNRIIYSHFCSRIAALGFVVVAVEHTDGLSSAAKLAGKRYDAVCALRLQ